MANELTQPNKQKSSPVVSTSAVTLGAVFRDQSTLRKLQDYFVHNVVLYDIVPEAYNFVRNFERFLRESPSFVTDNPAGYAEYEALLTQAKFVAIPMLRESELVDLFRFHFVDSFSVPDFNLWQKLKAKLVTIVVYAERDTLKRSIMQTLAENQQELTTVELTVDGQPQRPTVANWLKDYSVAVGSGKVDAVQQEQYLAGSKYAKSLEQSERERLRVLLKFFERLKVSSLDPDGIEEDYSMKLGDTWKTLHDGVWEEIRTPEVKTLAERAIQLWESMFSKKSEKAPLEVVFSPISEPKPSVAISQGPIVVPPLEPTVQALKQPALLAEKPVMKMALLRPVPQVLKSSEPAFMFDVQDELEADRFRISNSQFLISKKTLESELRELAEEVIKKYNFSFKDEAKHRRFVQLFVSRLKDVRDVVETREALLKSNEAGGLGLTSDKADQVVKIIEQARIDWIKDQGTKYGLKARSPKPEARQPVAELDKLIKAEAAQFTPSFLPATKTPAETTVKLIEQPVVLKELQAPVARPEVKIEKPVTAAAARQVINQELDKLKSEVIKPDAQIPGPQSIKSAPIQVKGEKTEQDQLKQWREEMLQEIARVAPPQAAPNPKSQIPNPKSQIIEQGTVSNEQKGEVRRPRVEDVKAPPRTLGPLEELKSLTLVDFRRLATTPAEALNKIKGKIDLIGEASLAKKLEAIKAWQNSVVYQLYLKLGRESIEQGKTMALLIKDQAARGEATLTEQEFEAVADFNQKLRF